MAGYWPSSFFCVYGPRQSRGPLTLKKMNEFNMKRSLPNKEKKTGFIRWLLGKFFLRDVAGSPEQVR